MYVKKLICLVRKQYFSVTVGGQTFKDLKTSLLIQDQKHIFDCLSLWSFMAAVGLKHHSHHSLYIEYLLFLILPINRPLQFSDLG